MLRDIILTRPSGYPPVSTCPHAFCPKAFTAAVSAGLLTFSVPGRLPAPKPGSGERMACGTTMEITVAGTAPDSHRIPF